jgi:pimeloyl-ACP methyl ester carboxylesterase
MTPRDMNVRLMLIVAFCAPAALAATRDVSFESHGEMLSGSIVLPEREPARAALVFVHGSGQQTRNLALAERLASVGIATLVYDKRGAGRSGGEYEGKQSVSEKNISLLADDAVAAFDSLSRQPSLAGVPVGFAGISQAGWIVPVAATRARGVRFLVLWSGPVCKVSEEDIYSLYTHDAPGRTVPAYAQALASRTEPYVWPDFLGVDTDPATSLRTADVPGLWIFSDNDGSIPVDLSISRLKTLRDGGRAFDYALFSGLGHDNIDGTFDTAVSWIRRTTH